MGHTQNIAACTFGNNFNGILIGIQIFSSTKMYGKISSAKWRSFCPGEDELVNDFTKYLRIDATSAIRSNALS